MAKSTMLITKGVNPVVLAHSFALLVALTSHTSVYMYCVPVRALHKHVCVLPNLVCPISQLHNNSNVKVGAGIQDYYVLGGSELGGEDKCSVCMHGPC